MKTDIIENEAVVSELGVASSQTEGGAIVGFEDPQHDGYYVLGGMTQDD